MNERLSLCLIVKDEAALLPAFLAGVSGLWDELVAVDTGSRDNTVPLLRQAGALVLSRPWTHDFAAARNHSLDAASGDWVLVLDPDERCSPEFVRQARALLGRADAGAATLQMRNVREDGHVHEARLLRMFRRNPDVRFRHAIHEDVSESLWPVLAARAQQLVHLSAQVEHLGYARTVAAARGKKDRDVGILNASLQRDPDDLYLHFKRLEQARFWSDPVLWHSAAQSGYAAVLRAPRVAMGHWVDQTHC
jgi:glycosyltransferase involved in cell wall biosynthesis